jgi:hypothetical protein
MERNSLQVLGKSEISNEVGRCQEVFFIFFESSHLFSSQSGTPLRVRRNIPSPDGSFAVVDLCFVSTLRTQPRHFITLVLPTKHLFDPEGP